MSCQFSVTGLELRTRHAFTIARGGGDRWENVLLQASVDGEDSWGEGAPRSYYHEDLSSSRTALQRWTEGCKEADLEEDSGGELLDRFEGPMAARAAPLKAQCESRVAHVPSRWLGK